MHISPAENNFIAQMNQDYTQLWQAIDKIQGDNQDPSAPDSSSSNS